MGELKRKPEWLRIKKRPSGNINYVNALLSKHALNTVCEHANCPNKAECFSKKTATFMILGKECTRNCRYCNVSRKRPEKVDETEPENIAQATLALGLNHVVVTSVTRDDLVDGGALHFARVIEAIRAAKKNTVIEVLIPDFNGDQSALKTVLDAKPDILNHNIEAVPDVFKKIRSMGSYTQSLELLKNSKEIDSTILTKSGIMVGFGESTEEVLQTCADLRRVDCDFLTIGQYLPPSKYHYPLEEYVHPDQFDFYKKEALKMGFKYVASGPLVRSSYEAAEMFETK